MRSRAAGPLTFAVNLAAFGVCAVLAFARNTNALFFHYDGSYMLVDARDQLRSGSGQPVLDYANNFLQSIGNIQFPQNARLLFYYWPIGWFSDLRVAKIASCLVVAAVVFAAAYAMARLLSQSRAVALIAAWIFGFTVSPFVPLLYFYPILYTTPDFLAVVVTPMIAFWLVGRAGRDASLVADAASVLGLLALAFYVLAAEVLLLPIIVVGAIPCVALALYLARSRPELWRKLAVLAAALVVAVALRWPWYVIGLFLDTAPNFFPDDYTVVYHDKFYASIMFQGGFFGRAGPLLVAVAALGAALSLKSAQPRLRAAAWMTLALIALFFAAGFILVAVPHWIWPSPIYFELAIWPLYAIFTAVAAHAIFSFAAGYLARAKPQWVAAIQPRWIVLPAVFVVAAVMVLRKPPTVSGYPFPPQVTPVVAILKDNIALDAADAAFKGRIMTVVPVKPDGGDAWLQQFTAAGDWARDAGNDEMTLGLWYYRIPTLFEYNQFLSPEFHALLRRALQRPPIAHQRNITVLDHPDSRVLRLLGVRYVLMPRPDASLGTLRASEDRSGVPWGLLELPQPNLATYSPTAVEVRRDLPSILDFLVDDGVDLSQRAVAPDPIPGPLTPARVSALSMAGKDLRVVAESDGRSLVVVPVEFSHCLALSEAHPGAQAPPAILRVDGLLTGILFEHRLDAVLSFRISPLRNTTCRWHDYQDVKAMLR
jgi:hypothetical protein